MLAGTVYAKGRDGYFTDILHALGKNCEDPSPIVNYYNPVPPSSAATRTPSAGGWAKN
jgi:hypothetical protein